MMGPLEALQQMRAELAAEIAARQVQWEAIDQAIAILSKQAAPVPEPSTEKKTSRGSEPPLPAPPEPSVQEGAGQLWSETERDLLRELWADRVPTREIADTLNRSISAVQSRAWILELPKRGRIATKKPSDRAGKPKIRIKSTERVNGTAQKPKRRFEKQFKARPWKVGALRSDHPAVIEKTTIFPSKVVDVKDSPRLLVSGQNSRKLGDRVVKGPWAGMPIYSLTLEERATCPETCHHWRTCYGNGMPRARRHRHGVELVEALGKELYDMSVQFPDGFVVRLHQLGDFYSNEYVCSWRLWLNEISALRVFGYTAHGPKSKIGLAVGELNRVFGDRCVIRFSDATPQIMGATTIWREARGQVEEGTVCPAQTGDTDCCGTCGLCWHPNMKSRCIVFMAHGPSFEGRPPAAAVVDPKRQGLARKSWPAETREAEEAEAPPEEHKPFRKALDRRCYGCGEIFASKSPNEAICALCLKKNDPAEQATGQVRLANTWANEKFADAIAASGGRYENDARAKLDRDMVPPPADVTAEIMGDPAPGRSAA